MDAQGSRGWSQILEFDPNPPHILVFERGVDREIHVNGIPRAFEANLASGQTVYPFSRCTPVGLAINMLEALWCVILSEDDGDGVGLGEIAQGRFLIRNRVCGEDY
jgi:hypothetical protein